MKRLKEKESIDGTSLTIFVGKNIYVAARKSLLQSLPSFARAKWLFPPRQWLLSRLEHHIFLTFFLHFWYWIHWHRTNFKTAGSPERSLDLTGIEKGSFSHETIGPPHHTTVPRTQWNGQLNKINLTDLVPSCDKYNRPFHNLSQKMDLRLEHCVVRTQWIVRSR